MWRSCVLAPVIVYIFLYSILDSAALCAPVALNDVDSVFELVSSDHESVTAPTWICVIQRIVVVVVMVVIVGVSRRVHWSTVVQINGQSNCWCSRRRSSNSYRDQMLDWSGRCHTFATKDALLCAHLVPVACDGHKFLSIAHHSGYDKLR